MFLKNILIFGIIFCIFLKIELFIYTRTAWGLGWAKMLKIELYVCVSVFTSTQTYISLFTTGKYIRVWICLCFLLLIVVNYLCACMPSHSNCVQLFATPWTIAHQAPLSMEFSRQEYWSGLLCPPPGNLSNPGIDPMSPVAATLQVDS